MNNPIFKAVGKAFLGLSAGMSWLAAFWIFLIMVFMTADILGRALFNHPLAGAYEIVRVSIVGIVFLQIPHTLLQDKHIRSNLVIGRLKPATRELANAPINLIGAAVFILIFISNWAPTLLSWKILEIEGEGALQVPVYPIRTIILLGSAAMVIHFIVKFFQNLSIFMTVSKRG